MRKAMILLGTAVLFIATLAAPAEAAGHRPGVGFRTHTCVRHLPGIPFPIRTCAIRLPFRPIAR